MRTSWKTLRGAAVVLALASTSACSGTGGLGSVLGSVLGGGQQQQNQISGYVRGVDTRNRQIGIQQQNGQTVTIGYDQNTQVVYQNQNYAVTSLEDGDQVTLRLQQSNNGGYYTDLVQVDQSVRGNNGSMNGSNQSGNVQSIQGTVRSINQQQGWFQIQMQNGAQLTVQLPSQVSRNDVARFNSLRNGDFVRFYGVVYNNNNVELRQFQ